MARIAGVDLPNKHVNIALTYIYGIGRSSADEICKKTNIDPNRMMNDLNQEEVGVLRTLIDSEYKVEGRLRTEIGLNIKRLMDIGCYRGLRHRKGFLFMDSALEPILELAKVKRRPLQVRRNNH